MKQTTINELQTERVCASCQFFNCGAGQEFCEHCKPFEGITE